MKDILEFLSNAKIIELASDTRVVFAAAVLFILAVLFRWKVIMLLLFAIGATIGVIRYANVGDGQLAINQNLITFSLGTAVVAGILIYFLFIRSD
ncbi:MAG: hypothetical protein H6Q84_391 [Deltaproteobacteria bacterium]|nr:hypothetical protein [Deltaproteobacteria bacterium]